MQSVKFREEMWEKGVYIVLGLPSSAGVSQKMDPLYQMFKGQCRGETLALFSEKLSARSKHIKAYKYMLRELRYTPPEDTIDTMIDVDEDVDDIPSDQLSPDISDGTSQEVKTALKYLGDALTQPTLNNDDLAYIDNGCEGEKFHERPFDFTSTEERIMKCNTQVGCVPFTRACLKNRHVTHEVVQREKNEDVERVNNEYPKARRELKD